MTGKAERTTATSKKNFKIAKTKSKNNKKIVEGMKVPLLPRKEKQNGKESCRKN